MTIKVGLRLQIFLIDYKWLWKLDLDCMTAWTYTMKLSLGLKGHPKLAWPIHHIQGRYLIGKWLGFAEIYYRTLFCFSLRNYIQRRAGEAKKYPRWAFWRTLFIYVCQGHPLEKFVVSAFLDYKSLKCSLFSLQKFVVRFLRLQKFVVSAFLDYKNL